MESEDNPLTRRLDKCELDVCRQAMVDSGHRVSSAWKMLKSSPQLMTLFISSHFASLSASDALEAYRRG